MAKKSFASRVLSKVGRLSDPIVALGAERQERRLCRNAESHLESKPPVFLIGAPRSGSTLLYKVCTEHFELGFMTNYMARWYLAPASALSRQLSRGLRTARGYEFNYGAQEGGEAPSEAGAFWYRWFKRGMDVGGVKPGADLQLLRREVAAMTGVWGTSMAFKNLYNTMRIDSLMEALPESCFVVCKRDLVENALSILAGRVDNAGSKDAWWSAPPKGAQALMSLPYPEQVVQQVRLIEAAVEEARGRYGTDRFIEVRYESFCSNVHGELDRIKRFFAERGVHAPLRNQTAVPSSFEASVARGDAEDRQLVTEAARTSGVIG